MPVFGNVHPITIEKFDIFRDVISLFARVVIFLIDRTTQEVPMNIFERNCHKYHYALAWDAEISKYGHRPFYDGLNVTTYTTHQWYVVLEVLYVGKPPTTHVGKPTTHVGGVKWYVVLEVFCVVYVGKPPTTHVGKPTTHVGGVKWYVVLEVFCVVNVGKPPTRHTNMSCWFTDMCCWRFTDIHNTKNLQHYTPTCRVGLPTCVVGGLPTYTTQNTSNTTYAPFRAITLVAMVTE